MGQVKINGALCNMEVAANLMDDEIREELASQGFENEQDFADAYAAAHAEKFGEVFVVN